MLDDSNTGLVVSSLILQIGAVGLIANSLWDFGVILKLQQQPVKFDGFEFLLVFFLLCVCECPIQIIISILTGPNKFIKIMSSSL
jgi:hypothetical protein